MDKAIEGCDLLIGGVSSFGVEWFAENVLPIIPKDLPALSITKGMHADENGNFIPFPDYLATKPGCDNISLNAVGGPCISFELADRHLLCHIYDMITKNITVDVLWEHFEQA